ncbi:MAG: helix-turn-helix domain-containing protein [Flexilinea sp.]
MYRVVIIDDEEIIVYGLQTVVNWQAFDCTVVATALNAGSGAVAIRTYKPDILFTDIKLPDRDGLTMLAGLKSEFPNMQVTVLTGYTDFEYAQKAVRLGVARLLLKPSHMDEIHEAMKFMTEKLKQSDPSRNEADEQESPSHNANSFIVRQAMAFMEENYNQKITLQDVADQCYVSQWHLSKLLNRKTGQSFYDLLNGMRINAAKRLLIDPKLRICDICELVGYADTAHFSRTFKKMEGMSANEYRNSTLKN